MSFLDEKLSFANPCRHLVLKARFPSDVTAGSYGGDLFGTEKRGPR